MSICIPFENPPQAAPQPWAKTQKKQQLNAVNAVNAAGRRRGLPGHAKRLQTAPKR